MRSTDISARVIVFWMHISVIAAKGRCMCPSIESRMLKSAIYVDFDKTTGVHQDTFRHYLEYCASGGVYRDFAYRRNQGSIRYRKKSLDHTDVVSISGSYAPFIIVWNMIL
jgi:hypothetical protein